VKREQFETSAAPNLLDASKSKNQNGASRLAGFLRRRVNFNR
jgi:hypothetical protein